MTYDGFAEVYDRHWGGWAERALPDLDRMGLGSLAPGDRVLDLCCGTGRLAALLAARPLLVERAHPVETVVATLEAAGFAGVEAFDANDDLGWGETGRVFLACRKPTGPR